MNEDTKAHNTNAAGTFGKAGPGAVEGGGGAAMVWVGVGRHARAGTSGKVGQMLDDGGATWVRVGVLGHGEVGGSALGGRVGRATGDRH